MQYLQMKNAIKSLAEQDLSISDSDILVWVNQGINRINVDLEVNIPEITGSDTEEPAFDRKYHESLVVFANAKYRESDADFNSASYFIAQFNDMIRKMQRTMEIPPSADSNAQQVVVTDATQTVYKLSIPIGAYYGTIRIYKNDIAIDENSYQVSPEMQTVTFKDVTLLVGDKITVKYEGSPYLDAAPYPWWNF
jgi:hypothetical protein